MADMKKTMKILTTTMMDPTRVAIWFEILRKPKTTAYELMKVIAIKKTAMYYHLSILEEEGIIKGEVIKKQKYYKAALNFFELYGEAKELLKQNQKDMDAFSLMIINSFIQRELKRLQEMSSEEYRRKKHAIPYTGLWFSTREKIEKVKDEHKQLWDKILEVDEGEGAESVAHIPLTYFWGIIDFE
ncbi:MAG: winged helix-turn-helix transcriptional regulator [Asgard group archaeon]|nr:winged helix-turn-helix transcriptional regulator [Asgard group archaeon]